MKKYNVTTSKKHSLEFARRILRDSNSSEFIALAVHYIHMYNMQERARNKRKKEFKEAQAKNKGL